MQFSANGTRRRVVKHVAIYAALAAAVGALAGTSVGVADAEEHCANDIPPEVREALEEMSARDDRVDRSAQQGPRDERSERGDRGDLDEATGAESAAEAILTSATAMIATPEPSSWMPRGRRCQRRRGRRGRRGRMVCDGPRRVPEPHGEAAELAERLGIGTRRMGSQILLGPADETWTETVEGEARDTLLWPVPEGSMWRGFGYVRRGRRARRIHKGIDIGAPDGTPIRSVNDGLVIYADNEITGYGNLMMVLHKDGSVAFYAHCHRLFLFPGQQVTRGQVIGEVGHTGLARGPHLHFEWRVNGRPRNPMRRMVGTPDEQGGRRLGS